MTEPITKDEILKTLKFAREIATLSSNARAHRHYSKDLYGQATPARSRNNRNRDHCNNPRWTLLPRHELNNMASEAGID